MLRVYTWGMACYGALGVPNYIRKRFSKNSQGFEAMHYPNRCPLAEKRKTTSIACGHGFTVFGIKDPTYHILGTGINTDGQIGKWYSIGSCSSEGWKLHFGNVHLTLSFGFWVFYFRMQQTKTGIALGNLRFPNAMKYADLTEMKLRNAELSSEN